MSSVIKSGFCSKLTSEFDGRMKQLNNADAQLNNYLKSLRLNIATNTSWSPHANLRAFERSIASNINNLVPSLTTFDEIVDLVNRCLFTKNDPMFSKPSTMAKALKDFVKSNSSALINSLASAIPTEINLSNALIALKGQLLTSRVNLVVPESMQALNCMSGICGTDITSRLYQLENFMSKYSITDLGEIDVKIMLAAEGLVEGQIKSVERVLNTVENVMDNIDNAFTSGVDRLKRLVPDDDDDE